MTAYAPRTRWRRCWLLVLTGALIPSGPVGAQSLPACNRDLDRTPLLRGDPALAFWADQPVNESASGSTLRFRMPGMMPGAMPGAMPKAPKGKGKKK